MSNHIHLIVRARESYKLSDILRDFKKHTSSRIIGQIEVNHRESRREWMLELFRKHGRINSNNTVYPFWRQENHPIELSTKEMMDQRLNYIHENPVQARVVLNPMDYVWSSASAYREEGNSIVKIKILC